MNCEAKYSSIVQKIFVFQNKKTLSLITVHYEGGEHDVDKLISSCPMLQSLYIERKGYDNVSKFVISSRVLKNLKVKISDDGSFERKRRKEKN